MLRGCWQGSAGCRRSPILSASKRNAMTAPKRDGGTMRPPPQQAEGARIAGPPRHRTMCSGQGSCRRVWCGWCGVVWCGARDGRQATRCTTAVNGWARAKAIKLGMRSGENSCEARLISVMDACLTKGLTSGSEHSYPPQVGLGLHHSPARVPCQWPASTAGWPPWPQRRGSGAGR